MNREILIIFRAIILNGIAIAGGVIGSVLVAADIGLALYGYLAFTIGTVVAIILQYGDKSQRGLMWLNVYFICVNVFGLIRRINLF
jgi:hypothetical protein